MNWRLFLLHTDAQAEVISKQMGLL